MKIQNAYTCVNNEQSNELNYNLIYYDIRDLTFYSGD